MTLQVDGDESTGWKIGQPKAFLATTSNASEPRLSPDGNWIAYQSSHGTTTDVHVRPYPGPGGARMISAAGGRQPVWSSPSGSALLTSRGGRRRAPAAQELRGLRENRVEQAGFQVGIERLDGVCPTLRPESPCSCRLRPVAPSALASTDRCFVGFNASFRPRDFKNIA